jgi:hypothetical protein
MSERDDRPDVEEGATPGTVGALDGAAKPDSVMPQEAPDPSTGPD